MQIEIATTTEHLTRLAGDWNRLAAGVPFRSAEWLHNWWNHFGSQLELFVPTVTDNGRLIGIAPWCVETSASRGRVVRFLGSGRVCSDYLSLLCEPGRDDDVASAVAAALENSAWDLLHLEGVAATDALIAKLIANLCEEGATVHREAGLNCWRIPLPATWDEYLSTLSKSHRKQMRQTERRVLDTGRAVLKTASTPDEITTVLQTLIDLHQRRRTSLGEPGCYACEQFSGFIRSAVPALAERLRATDDGVGCELNWIELDGRPVTVELHLLGDRIAYAYQAGVDPDVLDEEPGRLITLAALRRNIARGFAAYDFCRGDEPYKAHWRAAPHATLDLRVVPNSGVAQFRHGVWIAGKTMKQWVKNRFYLMGM